MMKLIANLSMLGPRPTGLGVYARHCAQALLRAFDIALIAGQDSPGRAPILAQAPAAAAIGAGPWAAIRRQLWMRSVRIGAGQLVYSPTHHGLPRAEGQVITIHDLICLRFPNQHRPQYLYFRFGLPRLLRRCRAVFTVSETTRQDIAATYGFPAERIHVVPNGVDRTAFSPAPNPHTGAPFLLMVGARYVHKNVDEVLDHAALWAGRWRLKVTSCSGAYRAHLERRVQAEGVDDRVEFLDYISFADLVALYQQCSALLYPSKWEGFGIPPLEALACGTPVIASDIAVHREVLGDAARLVALGDKAAWRQAFESISAGTGQPKRVTPAAEAVLQRFTWARSAEKLVDALIAVEPALAACRRLPAGSPA